MRLKVFAAAVVISATASAQPASMDQTADRQPSRPSASAAQPEKDAREDIGCRDRIQQVRDTSGYPAVRRESADPDKPLLIAAIDRRIDGCSVMVMRHDIRDIRPLPKVEQRPDIIPAR